jgi:hypothetical protein
MRTFALAGIALFGCSALVRADDWDSNKVWHDGLVEKAVYTASRVVYGKPRAYEAIFFTNKELHDRKTLTKADKSTDTIEVWKFNQIEDIPTPNYTYHYVATSHLTLGMVLTRHDCSSQEFCGTSFKQFVCPIDSKTIDYWSFSYMPEGGRTGAKIPVNTRMLVPEDALPLFLRGFNFSFDTSDTLVIHVLPSQKSNRATPHEPIEVWPHFKGDDGDSYKVELQIAGGNLLGTYWMAKDRGHVMTKYVSGDGQHTYQLKSVERVNYWTIKER